MILPNIIFAFLVLFLLGFHSANADYVQNLNSRASRVTFEGMSGSLELNGTLPDLSGTFLFGVDRTAPKAVKITANITKPQFKQSTTGQEMLLSAVTQSLPDSVGKFQSDSIVQASNDTLIITGTMSAFGQDKKVKVPVTVKELSVHRTRLTGALKQKDALFPILIPGLADSFSGAIVFDLVFE